MKNLNIMGLLRMEKYGFQKEWDAISPVQMYWDENESTESTIIENIETILNQTETSANQIKPNATANQTEPATANQTVANSTSKSAATVTANLTKTGNQNATTPGGAGYVEETQLVDSFLANAQKHNKTVMGNINSIEDDNESLKKKLIKSYLKHTNKNIMKKIKRFERKYSRNDKQDFLGFL